MAKKAQKKNGASRVPRDVRDAISDLMADYIQVLDDYRLEEWPDFFVDDCLYRIIPRENLFKDPPFAIVHNQGRPQLLDRIMIIRNCLVFSKRYDRHVVSNLSIKPGENGGYRMYANYLVGVTDVLDGTSTLFSAGKYDGQVVMVDGEAKFKQLDVIIDTYCIDKQVAIPL